MKLGWVDYSDTDREAVHNTLSLLQEKGALDELGIGTIRDAFSNTFFPGTSTLHTRARYLLIVPYTFLELERRGFKSEAEFMAALNRLEKLTCEHICAATIETGELGIIGSRTAGKPGWVVYSPSWIYWSSLRKYNLFEPRALHAGAVTRQQYIRSLCSANNEAAYLAAEETLQDTECVHGAWNIPEFKDTVSNIDSIQLTRTEAEHIKQHITASCEESLLAAVLQDSTLSAVCVDYAQNHSEWDSFESPLQLMQGLAPQGYQEAIEQALAFSALVSGAYLRFNCLLPGGQELADEQWRAFVPYAHDYANRVDIAKIKRAVAPQKVEPTAVDFVEKLITEFSTISSSEISWTQLDKLLRQREYAKKGERSKLRNPEKHIPGTKVGAFPLDYRFGKAASLVSEIEGAVRLHA